MTNSGGSYRLITDQELRTLKEGAPLFIIVEGNFEAVNFEKHVRLGYAIQVSSAKVSVVFMDEVFLPMAVT